VAVLRSEVSHRPTMECVPLCITHALSQGEWGDSVEKSAAIQKDQSQLCDRSSETHAPLGCQ
jgi:hypothetical protein